MGWTRNLFNGDDSVMKLLPPRKFRCPAVPFVCTANGGHIIPRVVR